MIFRFNTAQLEREMHDALAELLDVLQVENKAEIDISVVEFPKKFMVKLDEDVEMIIFWDAEKKKYSGLTEPQLEPEPTSESAPEPVAKEEPKPDSELEPSPKELAERAYVVMMHVLKLSSGQMNVFTDKYSRLLKGGG